MYVLEKNLEFCGKHKWPPHSNPSKHYKENSLAEDIERDKTSWSVRLEKQEDNKHHKYRDRDRHNGIAC